MTTPQRPEVDVTDEGAAVADIWAHMTASGDWYRRGGRAWRRDPGTGQPRPATAQDCKVWAGLRLMLTRTTAQSTRPGNVSGSLAAMLLEPPPEALPEIRGTRTHAFLRPGTGTVAQGAGYDPQTGYWIEPAADHAPVPDEPTAADVDQARTIWTDYARGWTFRAPSDAAAMLAAHMDPVIRLYVGGLTPGVFVTAYTMASGKTYGAETMTAMFGGRLNSAVKSGDMLGKQITTTLAQSGYLAVLCLDNIPNGSAFDSPVVSALLTAHTFADRAVCTATQVEVSGIDRPQLWVTGNNATLGGDNGSRFLPIRLDERDPNTPERRFTDADLAWALLTLGRAWVLAGALRRTAKLRQFTAWCSAAAGFCDWYGNGLTGAFMADHDQVIGAMDTESAEYERLGLAVLDLIDKGRIRARAGGWVHARQITDNHVTQDLLPRLDGRDPDRHIGHRAAGRNILRPRVGRRDGTVRVEERWNAHDKAYEYRWVRVDQPHTPARRRDAPARRRRDVRVHAPAAVRPTPRCTAPDRPQPTASTTTARRAARRARTTAQRQ